MKARETRAARQRMFLQEFRCPVVCFTMNIAGPVKTSPLIRRAFDAGPAALEDALGAYIIHSREIVHKITGDEAIFSVDAEASTLKEIGTLLEEGSPMGSHNDMDLPLFVESRALFYPLRIHRPVYRRPRSRVCFPFLREAGLAGEEATFTATCGANTHKGACGKGGTVLEDDGNWRFTVSGCTGDVGDTLIARYYDWDDQLVGTIEYVKK